MKRAGRSAETRERVEDAAVERAARMQHDFAAPAGAADLRKYANGGRERVVGSAEENDAGA
jgi:hypothetical protein